MSKYGSNTNRPLSEIVGLSTDTKPTDSIEGIKIQNGSSFRELDTGKRFLFDAENTTWNEVSSGGGGGGSTLIEKSISANGIYNASEDSADGYSKVTVNVPSGGVEFKNTPTDFSLNTNIDNLDVIIPNGVTSLGNSAFANCAGLKTIIIPNGVTSLGENSFQNCTGLGSIELPDSVRDILSSCFDGCSNLTSIKLSNALYQIRNYAFQNCTSLTSIEIPDSVEIIATYAFYGCSNLESVQLSNNLSGISEGIFRDCTSLASIEIPDSVTNIRNYAFCGCTGLQSIKFTALTPPTVSSTMPFKNVPRTCIIYVPTGTLSAYTSTANMPSSSTYTYVEY